MFLHQMCRASGELVIPQGITEVRDRCTEYASGCGHPQFNAVLLTLTDQSAEAAEQRARIQSGTLTWKLDDTMMRHGNSVREQFCTELYVNYWKKKTE